MHIFSEDTEQFPGTSAIVAALRHFSGGDHGDDEEDEDEDGSARDTDQYTATIHRADWSFFFKPGSLKFLSSSLFDIFDACFQKHYVTDKGLITSFLSNKSETREEMFFKYAVELAQEVKNHLATRTSKEHRDSIYARLWFYLFSYGNLHSDIPFMCNSMATLVNKRLMGCQHALSDVSCL